MASVRPYKKTKWRATVRRVGFAPRTRVFDSKMHAEAWARELETSMDQNKYRDLSAAKAQSVADLFIKFRNEVTPNRGGAKWETTRINKLLKEADFMRRRLDQIKFEDIRDWRDARLGNALPGNPNVLVTKVSPQSTNRELNLISGVFSYAMKEWSTPLAYNPCTLVARPKGAIKYRFRRWTDAELEQFLKAAEYDPDVPPKKGIEYVSWALLIACECAIRPKELCSLYVRDFHPGEKYVRVHKTKNDAHKMEEGRNVPLNKKALALFKKLCEGKKPADKIVPITEASLGVYYRELRTKAGLDDADLRFYDSRHEGTTRMAKKLPSPLQLSAATGHKNLQSLKFYYNPTPSELADMLD